MFRAVKRACTLCVHVKRARADAGGVRMCVPMRACITCGVCAWCSRHRWCRTAAHPSSAAACCVAQVRCLYAGISGLDISLYSAGIICGDLMARLEVTIDYARQRMGTRPAPAEE